MVHEYKKGVKTALSDHFSSTDFDCRCSLDSCDHTLIDSDLVSGLNLLFKKVNGLWLTSGYRCSAYNRTLKDAKPGSFHLLGKAADIQSHTLPHQLAEFAEEIPAFENGGMGVGRSFVHVDVRGYRARWSY